METLLYEYLLIFPLEKNIRNEITGIKNDFRDHYGCNYSAKLTPHCTFMHFLQYQHGENRLVREFDSIISSFSPFIMTLDGFGQYPIHTIYVKIKDDIKIKAMVNALKLQFRSVKNEIKLIKPIYLSDPHITIARSMTPTQFERAWTEWERRKFGFSFNAHNVRLLKRQVGEKDLKPKENYHIVKDFEFTSQVEKDKQLILF